MNDLVGQTIELIYKNRNQELYLMKCTQELILPDNFYLLLKDPELSIIDSNQEKISPGKSWFVEFEQFNHGEFNASFTTKLLISKLAPLFYIQHEFEVKNKVEKRIEPILGGYSGMPYIIAQYDFHKQISEVLSKGGYTELTYAEMYEVVCGLSFPEEVTIYGSQVTVEYALFHDLLDLCSESEVVLSN